ISLSISPVKDAAGRIIGASKIARDITEVKKSREKLDQLYTLAQAEVLERKKAEDRVRQMNEELEARVRERTTSLEESIKELNAFAYTVAHDLRAPLRAVHQYSDILREDHAAHLDAEGLEYVRRIAEGAERMDLLILDLLDYSRVARLEIQLVPIDVERLVSESIGILSGELSRVSGKIIVDRPLPPAMADSVLLSQAFINLLANAVKFVPRGRPPEVAVSGTREGDLVRLVVRDNGIGIAVEHFERIFLMFERLNPTEAYAG